VRKHVGNSYHKNGFRKSAPTFVYDMPYGASRANASRANAAVLTCTVVALSLWHIYFVVNTAAFARDAPYRMAYNYTRTLARFFPGPK